MRRVLTYPGWSKIEKRDGNLAACQFVDQARAELGGHDRDAADIVRHHPDGGLLGAPGS